MTKRGKILRDASAGPASIISSHWKACGGQKFRQLQEWLWR